MGDVKLVGTEVVRELLGIDLHEWMNEQWPDIAEREAIVKHIDRLETQLGITYKLIQNNIFNAQDKSFVNIKQFHDAQKLIQQGLDLLELCVCYNVKGGDEKK